MKSQCSKGVFPQDHVLAIAKAPNALRMSYFSWSNLRQRSGVVGVPSSCLPAKTQNVFLDFFSALCNSLRR